VRPTEAVIWVCVLVFSGTAVITLLHLSGAKFLRIPEVYAKQLVKILIIQIATASTGAFGYHIYHEVRRQDSRQLPNEQLMVIERADPVWVLDGDSKIFVDSPDILLCHRPDGHDASAPCDGQSVELRLSSYDTMESATTVTILTNEAQHVTLGANRYKLSFRLIGKLWPNAKIRNSTDRDFVLLTIEKA
jgi:hypothetical protein